VLLAASQDLADPRKGLGLLMEALRNQTRPLTLLMFGSGAVPVQLPRNIRLLELGPIDEEERKMRVFNAADIYVHPALEDNLPNTVAESIACGTPVVAFDVGGLPEMVLPGVTGWLAGAPAAESLSRSLDTAFDSPVDRLQCRRNAELMYDLDRCSEEYEDTLRLLTHRRHNGGVQ
jgi:glycosyltransferase involved in cell wall biosynthesis